MGKECKCEGSKAAPLVFLKHKTNKVKIVFKKFEGKRHAVVPVVLMRSDVVMNGGHVPEAEIFPAAWNGVPVTLSHPAREGAFMSANSPDVLEEFAAGRIFNAFIDEGALKAEAWIDVDKANELRPGLISELAEGIDVSTGYFAEDVPEAGTLNGREFTHIQRNIRPDHLALLPDEKGACSFEDGCGVRSNTGGLSVAKKVLASALAVLSAHILGSKDAKPKGKKNADKRQMIADLIGMEGSPFKDTDEPALAAMSDEAIAALYAKFKSAEDMPPEEEPEAKADDMPPEEEPETKEEMPPEEDEEKKSMKKQHMNKDDRAALDHARKVYADHRNGLISRIVSNSDMKKEALEAMETTALEVIANGLRSAPEADYSARGAGGPILDTNKGKGKDMVPISMADHIAAKRKKG